MFVGTLRVCILCDHYVAAYVVGVGDLSPGSMSQVTDGCRWLSPQSPHTNRGRHVCGSSAMAGDFAVGTIIPVQLPKRELSGGCGTDSR